MNFDFYNSHIETLCDLQALAKKHNCKLAFGTRNNSFDDEIDESFLKEYLDCPEDIAKEICEKCDFIEVRGNYTNSFFELYDKEKGKYNTLTYFTLSGAFKIVTYEGISCQNNLSGKTKDWLADNSMNGEWGYDDLDDFYMHIDATKEEVHGFEGIKKEGHIYRPGIMLAVFTQLVCDYLKEERIVRTY